MHALLESPTTAALAGLVLVIVLVVGWRLIGRRSSPATPRKKSDPTERRLESVDTVAGWPPTATRMLSQPERRVMALLRDALPDYMILAQVPLARFLKVPERYSYSDWMRRVGHVSVDFLVCDLSANVIAAVELRDTDNDESDKARRRHVRMDRVLAAAGIKVHVWRDANLPQITTARELILGAAAGQPGNSGRHAAGKAGAVPLYDEVPDTGGRDDPVDPRASTWFDELQPTQPTPLGPPTRH
jgi:hypothetical protein